MRPRHAFVRLRNTVALVVAASLVLNFESPVGWASQPLPPAGPVTYSYDASGRLIGASEPGVGSVTHSYDAAGNLTATTPSTSTDPQVMSLTPQHATPGSTVVLRGANFSSTASDDQVSFGGGAVATVSAAAAGSLTVTVPAAATSGPVSVTVGGITATGPSFAVDPSGQAPTVTGFSPSQVGLGATLTVSGSHFDPNPTRNVVQINQTRAPVTAASASSLTVTVPQGAVSSGKVSVSTPAGVATSTTDLYVLPAALAASVFDAGQRVALPGTATLATSGSGHAALAEFDAPANGRLFVREGISGVPSCNGVLTVYDPRGNAIGSDSCVWSNDNLDDLPLRMAGTYSVALSTNGSGGSLPVTLTLVPPDSSTAVNADGSPTTVTTSIGQSANLTFTATAGQRVFINITNSSEHTTTCAQLNLLNPTGTSLTTGYNCGNTSYIDTTTLPTAGTYTLLLNPGGTDSGSATIAISTVAPDSSTAVNADGSPTTVTTSIGQSANLTFTATAGQRVFINITNSSEHTTTCAQLNLLNPTGTSLTTGYNCGNTSYIDTTTLPTAGTYTLLLNPGGTDSGSATIAISTVAPDSSTAVNADGSPTTVTTSIGQSANLTFTATAGQRVFINITNSSEHTTTCAQLNLLNPTGTSLTTGYNCGNTSYIDTTTLPTAGTYTLLLNPGGTDSGSATIAISTVAPDSSTAVNADGSPTTVTTSIGQSANLTFTATAGQRVFINITNSSEHTTTCAQLNLLNPTGTSLTTGYNCGNTSYIDTTTLPTAGTYTLLLNPGGTDSGSATIAISTVAPDSSTAVNADGSPTTVTTSIGQSANLTFTATAGQRVFINITNSSEHTTTCAQLNLLNPTGTSLTTGYNCGNTSYIDTTTLPTAGTYTLLLNPGGTDSGSATIAISTITSLAAGRRSVSTLPSDARGSSTAAGVQRTDTVRAVLDDGREHARPTTVPSPAQKIAQPTVPGWVKSVASSRDGWQPTRSNLAGVDWLSHRTPAPAASLPPLAAPPGVTALAGQVLTVGGTPLPGVTLSADGHATRSDGTGRFLLTGISGGQRVLLIDGGTASKPGRRFGIFQVSVHTIAGRTVPLGYPIWLTKLDEAHATTIPSPTTRQTVLTTPEIPGFEVVLPAGTVVRDLQGRIVRQLSITPVPTDRPPFPLPDGVVTPAYFTVQPGGSYIFPQGARIIYPNSLHARPGSRVQFYNYDPTGRGWYIYGGGSVTADGKQVVPDSGVKVWTFTGAMINIPGLGLPGTDPSFGGSMGGMGEGDPVDPGTGLFDFAQTDLAESDTLPITLTRSYRQLDSNQYAFGQGFNWTYGIYQWSAQQYQQADLVFPNGSHIHFIRISPGTGYTDAVFRATNGWGDFANAVMRWNGNRLGRHRPRRTDLRLR